MAQTKLERQIEQAEAALRSVEDELADPSIWETPEKSAKASERHARAKQTVESLYERYEQIAG